VEGGAPPPDLLLEYRQWLAAVANAPPPPAAKEGEEEGEGRAKVKRRKGLPDELPGLADLPEEEAGRGKRRKNSKLDSSGVGGGGACGAPRGWCTRRALRWGQWGGCCCRCRCLLASRAPPATCLGHHLADLTTTPPPPPTTNHPCTRAQTWMVTFNRALAEAAGVRPPYNQAAGKVVVMRLPVVIEVIKTRGLGFKLRDGATKSLEAAVVGRPVVAGGVRTGPTGQLVVELAGPAAGAWREVRRGRRLTRRLASLPCAAAAAQPQRAPSGPGPPPAQLPAQLLRVPRTRLTRRRLPILPSQSQGATAWKLSRSTQDIYQGLQQQQQHVQRPSSGAARRPPFPPCPPPFHTHTHTRVRRRPMRDIAAGPACYC
jgi:hypothetical protein